MSDEGGETKRWTCPRCGKGNKTPISRATGPFIFFPCINCGEVSTQKEIDAGPIGARKKKSR